MCAFCMTNPDSGTSAEFDSIRGSLPAIRPGAAVGNTPLESSMPTERSGRCQVCREWSEHLTGQDPTCPACLKLSVSELRDILRRQTREEIRRTIEAEGGGTVATSSRRGGGGGSDGGGQPSLLKDVVEPTLATGRKRVALEISGFDPDVFTDALDEDDECVNSSFNCFPRKSTFNCFKKKNDFQSYILIV
jgi:hypothetical protein